MIVPSLFILGGGLMTTKPFISDLKLTRSGNKTAIASASSGLAGQDYKETIVSLNEL
ncbi:MAG TPA: hypothetical protein V6D11_01255 [Waterburya sp.]|jgi:hypothetical protein